MRNQPGVHIDAQGYVEVGDTVDIAPLLKKLDERLRTSVVHAAETFLRRLVQFPGVGVTDWETGQGLKSAAIMKYWGVNTGGNAQITDCLGAGRIIMARALIDVITAKDFDALYTAGSVPMKDHNVPISQMKRGDWGCLLNDERYKDRPVDLGYRGENIIKVGDDNYFGFPTGPQSLAAWTQTLITEFNNNLQPGETKISTIPGWCPDENVFLDVATIAMKVFDHRDGKSG